MAQQATAYRFQVQLSHVDRSVYQELDVKMARHPSETERYLLLRLLAYCFLYQEGLAFSKGGLSSPDEPPLTVRTLDGTLTTWVEIGQPSAERLHKAAKAAPRVVLFTHTDARLLLDGLANQKIHRRELVEVWRVDPGFLDAVAAQVGDRGARLELTITEAELYLGIEGETVTGTLERVSLAS